MAGYDYAAPDFAELLLRKFYPEKTDRESGVMRDFLVEHLAEFDRVSFNVRVGDGVTPNPDHLPGVQRSTAFSSKKKIDILAWQGSTPTIIEVKERVTPAALGQVLTYRQLFQKEHPDASEPRLVVVGRYSDEETLATLAVHGVDVYLYEPQTA
jgi:hypothetical protein